MVKPHEGSKTSEWMNLEEDLYKSERQNPRTSQQLQRHQTTWTRTGVTHSIAWHITVWLSLYAPEMMTKKIPVSFTIFSLWLSISQIGLITCSSLSSITKKLRRHRTYGRHPRVPHFPTFRKTLFASTLLISLGKKRRQPPLPPLNHWLRKGKWSRK